MSISQSVGGLVRNVIAPATLVLALIVFWQSATVWFDIPEFILPAPTEIAATFVAIWPILAGNAVDTLVPTILGFVIGGTIGVVLAVLLDVSPVMRNTLYPLVLATQTTPKIAIAPLLIVWFGVGLTPKVIIVALLAMFPVLINVLAGLAASDRGYVTLARSVNATQWQIYRTIKIPSAVPYLFAGMKLGMTNAIIGAIIGEWMGSDRGLGYLLVYYNSTLNTIALFAVLVLLVVIAGALFGAIAILERWLSWESRLRRHQSTVTNAALAAKGGV